jgi:hypothetical protein
MRAPRRRKPQASVWIRWAGLARAVARRGSCRTALLQRDVGFEYQMLKTTVPPQTSSTHLPIAMNGWRLEPDGANLEFIIDHTANRGDMETALDEVRSVAAHFLPNFAGAPFVHSAADSPELQANWPEFEAVRAATGVTQPTGQPQVNADVRLDDVDLFFSAFDAGNAEATAMFAHTMSFPPWSKTAPELAYASNRFVLLPYDEAARLVNPAVEADRGVEVAKVRGLFRLMYQYLVHGRQEFQPPEDMMKDLPYLSKSNMGLAAASIQWGTRYADAGGIDRGTVTEHLLRRLAQMSGRTNLNQRVFAGMSDVPKINQWVAGIVKNGDDPLASLGLLDVAAHTGRTMAAERANYPTSLGGLGLAPATTALRASDGATANIPTLIIEFRRLPEIPIGQWRDRGLDWFDYFEDRRTQTAVQDLAPPAVVPASAVAVGNGH